MVKKSGWFLSFVFACLIIVPIIGADEGDVGDPHNDNIVEQQK